MAKPDFQKELDAVAAVLKAVSPLEEKSQAFVFRMAMERLGISGASGDSSGNPGAPGAPGGGAASGGAAPRDAKAFLKDKKPISEVQRVAVLAYYLDKYKQTPEFKTPDIVSLNTDAGGLKIGNPARAVDNATRRSHYLVSVKGAKKKISAHGEDVVDALPDQSKVAEVEASFVSGTRRPRRKRAATKS